MSTTTPRAPSGKRLCGRARGAPYSTYPIRYGWPLTTGQVATVCCVAPKTVVVWIDSGLLPGYVVPGSKDRRVNCDDFVAFCKKHGIETPRELRAGAVIVAGLEARSLSGAKCHRPTTDTEFGYLVGAHRIGAAVLGDCDGLEAMARRGAFVRLHWNDAKVWYVVGGDVTDKQLARLAVSPIDVLRPPLDLLAIGAALAALGCEM